MRRYIASPLPIQLGSSESDTHMLHEHCLVPSPHLHPQPLDESFYLNRAE